MTVEEAEQILTNVHQSAMESAAAWARRVAEANTSAYAFVIWAQAEMARTWAHIIEKAQQDLVDAHKRSGE